MASMEEQETIITQNRADGHVSIYSSNTHDIAYFKKDSRFKLIREWFDAEDGTVEAAEFHIPKESANIRKIAKRVSNMTDEQKQVLRDRLAMVRNSN